MYKALLVCNWDYGDHVGALARLRGPQQDGGLLRAALLHQETGVFAEAQVRLLTNLPSADMLREVGLFFTRAAAEDVLLFYFSGHGRSKHQKLYLCGPDTDSSLLPSTALLNDTLNAILSDCVAQVKVLILDCCHSGAFKGDAIAQQLRGKGLFVLSATMPAELAPDADLDGQPSPFTAALIAGLTGGAASNAAGEVTLENLYTYLQGALAGRSEPSRNFNGYGSIPIARRPARPPKSTPPLAIDPMMPSLPPQATAATPFMDATTTATGLDGQRIAAFRTALRNDVAAEMPALLTHVEFLHRASLMIGGQLTRSGALLFGEDPTAVIPTAIVQCTQVHGTSKAAPMDKTDLRGTIPEQVLHAYEFVARLARRGEAPSEDDAIAQPVYAYPMVAVREILANALVHRDYQHQQVCVHVQLFSDRLEITSPGQWIDGRLTEGETRPLGELETQSRRRNFRLASTLTWMKIVEGEGSGIPRAIGDCRRNNAPEPTVKADGDVLTVTIYPRALDIQNSYGATGLHGPVTVRRPVDSSWPHLVGVLPPLAVGRLERQADTALRGAVERNDAVVLCQVLTGLGGVGKTQLAAGLAHAWWQERRVDLLVWVTATSRTTILAHYARAAGDVTGIEDPDPDTGAARFLAWLAGTSRRWLLVLDDVTDPTDLQGLWPPATAAGRVLVTTRRRDAALLAGRTVIDVGAFTPNEASAYLTVKLGDHSARLDEAAELAADLGYLPLALAQAAAYIVDQDLTCGGYRRRLDNHRLQTLSSEMLPDDQRTAVADIWQLSIDLADARTGGIAGILLKFAALLDPNGIPREFFTTATVVGYCAASTAQAVNDGDVVKALNTLHRLSLLTALAGVSIDAAHERNGVVRVHALVQRVVREHTSPQDVHDLAVTAADAMLTIWPEVERDRAYGQTLRANVSALYHNTGDSLLASDAHVVLFRNAQSRGEAGDPADAVTAFEQLLADCLRVLGPQHPDTLSTRGNLARWRGEAGDPAGAATSYEQLLTDQLRVLGPEHPDTLTTRSNLARWRGEAGDRAGAATAYEQLLTDRLRVLGAEHPDTLTTRNNLAYWRGEVGDPAGAATAYEQLLTDYLRVLGPDHPHTLAIRSNLAGWRGEAGDPAGAATAYEQLLTDYLRVLGPDHPDTLTTRHNLAGWRGEAGDPARAATAYEQLLTDRLRVLGPDHPDTLTTRHNLAGWRGEAGDPARAATAFEQLLADYLRVLGPDHPDTLTTRGNLARWRGEAGDPAGAATAFEQLLADNLRVLGPEHPDTLTARSNLARWRGQVTGGDMPGVEVIMAALAGGAVAGLTDTSVAVRDAYNALKDALKRRFGHDERAALALEADEADPGLLQARIADALTVSGAADDEDVLAAARRLTALSDAVTARFNINVDSNYGAIGEFHAPVTLHHGPAVPPPS